MNVLNRLIVSVLCLALIAGAVSVVVLAWSIPNSSIDGLRDAVDWLSDNNQDTEKAILTAIGAGIVLLALVLFLLELMPASGGEVRVTDLQGGNAMLSTTAISQRVEEAVREVPHVSDVRAAVRAKRKGVQVSLDLHVDPAANLASVTEEACQAARDVLQNRVHVALAEPPRARLHYRDLRQQRAAQARMAAKTPATTVEESPHPAAEIEANPTTTTPDDRPLQTAQAHRETE